MMLRTSPYHTTKSSTIVSKREPAQGRAASFLFSFLFFVFCSIHFNTWNVFLYFFVRKITNTRQSVPRLNRCLDFRGGKKERKKRIGVFSRPVTGRTKKKMKLKKNQPQFRRLPSCTNRFQPWAEGGVRIGLYVAVAGLMPWQNMVHTVAVCCVPIAAA